MKRHTHDSIGQVECFFNSITMMYVNVNVNDSRINEKKFQYCQNDVVNVAETTCLRLFCMMKAASEIDSYIGLSI